MGSLPPMAKSRMLPPLLIASFLSLFNKNNNPSPFMGKLFNDPLIKDFEPQRTKFDWLTHDERVVDKYVEDPLCGYDYSPRFYIQFIKGLLDINKSDTIFEGNGIPLLFISGKEDPVGEYGEGVRRMRELYSGHGFLDLTLKIIDNERHEILNEKGKAATYKFIIDWIEESLEKLKKEME